MEKSNLNEKTIQINSVKFHWSNKSKFKLHIPELSVDKGEKVLLLGESGSGKTTLLSLICGFLTPLSGNIQLNEKLINDLSATKRDQYRSDNIGIIFQQFNLLPYANVIDNILLPLHFSKLRSANVSDQRETAISICQSLRLPEDVVNMKASELSVGQQQRVAVARALVFDPAVVLMDEPLGALDKNLRESMQYEIKHIHESIGVTVVYVTHDQSEALTMSNRIAVFNDGKVQQLSSPDKLYEEPVNSFVAEFIGENNTFAGQVTNMSKDQCKVKLNDGSEIIANPVSVKSSGDNTTVSLRPERALINTKEKMDNNFKGKIEEVIYHGDHTRVRLDILGNKEFILKVPNSSANMDIKMGNQINVSWNSHDARALDPK